MVFARIVIGTVMTLGLLGMGFGVWKLTQPLPTVNLRTVRQFAEAGRFEEATVLLREHLQHRPNDSAARLLLGRLLVDQSESANEAVKLRSAEQALELLDPSLAQTTDEAALIWMYRAKALFRLGYWDAVETAARTALELDPTVPEAGWILLNQFYLEGRSKDSHDLALRLHAIEPDPRDRVQFLLELVRQDAQPPDAASLVGVFEPNVQEHPDELQPLVALGLSLVRSSRPAEGLEILQRAVERHPDDPVAWDGLMTGLDAAGRPDALTQALDQLPDELADDPRFAQHRGRAAQDQEDWPAAVDAYREAMAYDPLDPSLHYRLGRALRSDGREDEARPWLDGFAGYQKAMAEVRDLYVEANAVPTLGIEPHPDLYRRLGDLRRRMLRPDEARAWYQLVLEDDPEDEDALAALERLESEPLPSRTD